MTTHEVLVKARALIEDERDWRQGLFGPGRCIINAVADAASDRAATWTPASIVLGDVVGVPGVWQWNDAPGRTHAEVLAAFDKAIAATAPEPPDPEDLYVPEAWLTVAA